MMVPQESLLSSKKNCSQVALSTKRKLFYPTHRILFSSFLQECQSIANAQFLSSELGYTK